MKSDEISAAKRRHHERSFKADLILRSLVPGASVSAIALAAGINVAGVNYLVRRPATTILAGGGGGIY